MYTTSVVAGGQALPVEIQFTAGAEWPVTKRTPVARPRWVSGMPAEAAQPRPP